MSVPPIFAVYPDKNWYIACYFVSLATGGKTPLVSHVKNIIFFGWFPTAGIWALGKYSNGNEVLALGVIDTSLKFKFLVPAVKLAFYTIDPNLIELYIYGYSDFLRLLILAYTPPYILNNPLSLQHI